MVSVHANSADPYSVAVVIPCFKVRDHVLKVISDIGPEVQRIFVIDDCCPEQSGKHVLEFSRDPRVQVVFHSVNQGVGGATITGYREALRSGADIVIKIDGDGQMDTSFIPALIAPIIAGECDYAKANRFFSLESLSPMPGVRKFGNSVLSFINKATSGYWDIMDPTNGYTAIHKKGLGVLPLDKIDRTYFFESDMLFRLGTVRAVVRDVPLFAQYGEEESSLNVGRIILQFPMKYLARLTKRVVYTYFVRDFNLCSLELITGTVLCVWGLLFGSYQWIIHSRAGQGAATGTIMLAALPLILGFQLLLAAIGYDVANVPKNPVQRIYAHLSARNAKREQLKAA